MMWPSVYIHAMCMQQKAAQDGLSSPVRTAWISWWKSSRRGLNRGFSYKI